MLENGDVVINGYIQGTGSILASGNIYVPTDLQYLDGQEYVEGDTPGLVRLGALLVRRAVGHGDRTADRQLAGGEVDGQPGRRVRAGRIVGMNGAVGIDEGLQALQVRVAVLLIVDLDADPFGLRQGSVEDDQFRQLPAVELGA